MNGVNSYWTPFKFGELKRLADGSRSADTIATELGGGVTRNAVISKVHRAGDGLKLRPVSVIAVEKSLQMRGKPRPRRSPPKPPRAPEPPPAVALDEPSPVAEMFIPLPQRCSIHDLTDSTCRWPIGAPGHKDFFFCGGESVDGFPYCLPHSRIAYVAGSARRL